MSRVATLNLEETEAENMSPDSCSITLITQHHSV